MAVQANAENCLAIKSSDIRKTTSPFEVTATAPLHRVHSSASDKHIQRSSSWKQTASGAMENQGLDVLALTVPV